MPFIPNRWTCFPGVPEGIEVWLPISPFNLAVGLRPGEFFSSLRFLLPCLLFRCGRNLPARRRLRRRPNFPALQASQPNTPEMTAADVSAFIDGIMPAQLAREDIAGAVVLVIKDGKVLFTKGYGYSDVEKRIPVTPDGTLFRPGSISKLFTWTAVMQLVEAGKLDLDRDVNDYLDFKIPATYAQPITLRNIMTHTAGFEETVKDMWVPSPGGFVPLGDYLRKHIPGRIFPPGVTPAYSNYGCTLAGYIVQRVSGEAFDDYIERHIYIPLGMHHSTFRQPLPESLKSMMSNGYGLGSGPDKPFELIQVGTRGKRSDHGYGHLPFHARPPARREV